MTKEELREEVRKRGGLEKALLALGPSVGTWSRGLKDRWQIAFYAMERLREDLEGR